jgi:hypothetical protein
MLQDYFATPNALMATIRGIGATISYAYVAASYVKNTMKAKLLRTIREEREHLAGLYFTMKKEPVEERLVGYQSYCEDTDTHTEPPKTPEELRNFESQLEKRLETMK